MKDNMIHSVSVDYLRSLVTENPDQREGRIKAKTVGCEAVDSGAHEGTTESLEF